MKRFFLVPFLALCACQTQTMERDQMGLWQSHDKLKQEDAKKSDAAGKDGGSGNQPGEPPKPAKVITIPNDVAKAHGDFMARKSTIMADVVEVDLSREPWFGQATFAYSKDAIIRSNDEDSKRGVLTITLQRNPQVAPTMESIPTVRFGDGLRIVGVDRVTLRFWTKPSVERPMWFHAVGAGQSAFFKVETEVPQQWRGKSVDVRSEIHLVGEEYRFDSSAEAKP